MAYLEKTICVVIPAFRCSNTINSVIEAIPDYVDHIVVVDDNSPDDLLYQVKGVSDPRVISIRHGVNQGVGGAMVTGFKKALELKSDLIAKIDADGQMDPRHLKSFVNTAAKFHCDYVKANRFGHIDELQSMPKMRLLGNISLSFVTKFASGYWNLFDPQNGYVMITRSMLKKLDLDRIDKDYFFENSMLIQLNIMKAKVAEVYLPARYGKEVSSMNLRSILMSFPPKLLKGLCYRIYQKYVFRGVSPVFLFLATGVPALLFGSIFGAVHWYGSYSEGIQTPTGTIVISLLHFLLGALLLLQAIVLDVQDSGPSILIDYDDDDINL
jgi:dolichol-phosphate mannosyltransferase